MSNEESFGHIKIDSQSQSEEWKGKVPFLDYWKYRFNKSTLTGEQAKFYSEVKALLADGIKIKDYGVNPYLLMLRDELLKASVKRPARTKAIETIKQLNRLYDFHDFGLDEMLRNEAQLQRNGRAVRYSRTPLARWIPFGETVDVDGRHLTRGGFYLGNHLEISRYNTYKKAFTTASTVIEGPVVNLDPSSIGQSDIEMTKGYTTYLEMPADTKERLLAFLSGTNSFDTDILNYYLAGAEFRLLGDKRTAMEERADILRHLHKWRNSLTLGEGSEIRGRIDALILDVMARFFPEDRGTIVPETYMDGSLNLLRARLICILEETKSSKEDKAAMAQEVVDSFTLPGWIPEVYHKPMRDRLLARSKKELEAYSVPLPLDTDYKPISTFKGYIPEETIKKILMDEPRKVKASQQTVLNRFTRAFSSVFAELGNFRNALAQGFKGLGLANALPSWCNPLDMPGVADSLEEFRIADGEQFRTLSLGRLLDLLGITHEEYIDKDDLEILNMRLYKLGYRAACSLRVASKLSVQDSIAIYPRELGDVPRRGTLMISMFLTAWLLNAEEVKDQDMRTVDSWFVETDPKATWHVPAMAMMRWLTSRRLTLTQKRKKKAEQLAKFVKKRDELLRLLLTLNSDPETASPKRLKRLETVYSLVGLDPANIHSDIHRMATNTVSAVSAKTRTSATQIDKGRLLKMSESTHRAQEILSDVFSEDRAETVETVSVKPDVAGTGDATLEVLRLLNNKTEISRPEFDAICRRYGETVGSMLERLNDYAYDRVDETVAEDYEDTIYVDTDVVSQLLDN